MADKQVPWQLAIIFGQFTACLGKIMLNASKSLSERIIITRHQSNILDSKWDSNQDQGDSNALKSILEGMQFIHDTFHQIQDETETILNSYRYLSKLSINMMERVPDTIMGENIIIKRKKLCNSYKGKEILEFLIFGWIRKLIENKYNLNVIIPYYLKMLCLKFYGNIIMDTNLLNNNQLNTFGYVLQSFNLTGSKHFYAQKVYDSKTDGFDSKLFDKKCGILLTESIFIVRTNADHIFAFCRYNFDSQKQIGCILQSPQSPISTIPIVIGHNDPENICNVYHFSNKYIANFNNKLSEIITEHNNDTSVTYSIKNPPNKNNKLYISDFETFLFV